MSLIFYQEGTEIKVEEKKPRTRILDVGCGDKPHPRAFACGDLYLEISTHRNTDRVIQPKKLRNFVRFDCHHLPFKTGSFDIVYANHVLEHLENPLNALKEWRRVARKVIVLTPDLRGIMAEERTSHMYTWSRWSLENLLRKVFKKVQVEERVHPLLWERLGLTPRLFNYVTKRFLWRFFVFSTLELVGVAEDPIREKLSL